MFNKKIKEDISKLKLEVYKDIIALQNVHKVCSHCNITGHTFDMYKLVKFISFLPPYNDTEYYHYGCYAEKFNMHLCPCKCGKWISNKKKGCK